MSWLLAGATPIALLGLFAAIRQLLLKHLETSRDGWRIKIKEIDGPRQGFRYMQISIRPMGSAALHEVEIRPWPAGTPIDGSPRQLARMTSDSEPLSVVVSYPLPILDGPGPWVGVVWTDVVRLRPRQRAIRQNVESGELQRWVWFTTWNWFWFLRAPEGYWKTVYPKRKSSELNVPH